MISDLDTFFKKAIPSVRIFDAFAEKHALTNVSHADHICYKCDSRESFETIRALFEIESDYIHQAIISKRRIAYIKMKRSLETSLGPIWFLEPSDQKPDGSQQEGFDHIEVFPTSLSYEDFVSKLAEKEKVMKVERPHHTTHDIELEDGFIFRCTKEPLIEKIKETEL